MPHKAFISYSHAADGRLAPALQSALHRFAKPWYRLRAIHVFRDQTSLSVSPALWPAIERALADAEFFLLMASPEAAASPWVRQEIDYWLANRSIQKLLIVLTGGDLVWDKDAGRCDSAATTALPPNLQAALAEEPLFLDLRWAHRAEQLSLNNPRFRDAVADLAAPLHGRPKDEIIGEDVRQHRSTRRWAWSAVAGLVSLLMVSVFAAVQAVQQRDVAEVQRRLAEDRLKVAVARDLAAQATIVQQQEGRLLPRSVLLAIESLRRAPSLQATMALTNGLRLLTSTRRSWQHEKGSNAIDFSPDGDSIASAGGDGTVRVWRLSDGQERLRLDQGRTASNVRFSPNGRYLASASGFDGTAKVWQAADGQELLKINHSGQLKVLAFSPDSQRLLTAGGFNLTDSFGGQPKSPGAYVWDIAERRQLLHLAHRGSVTAAQFIEAGNRVITAGQDGAVRVWSGADASLQLEIDAGSSVIDLDVSRDGRWIAAGTSRHVAVWDAGSGRLAWRSERQRFDVAVVRFSPDGRLLASGGYDQTARVWDVASGHERARFTQDKGVFDVAFSADGAFLATAGADRTARVYDLARQEEIQLIAHRMPVFEVRVASGDRFLGSASQDGSVDVWAPPWASADGRDLSADGPISELAFSGSGHLLATGSGDAYADNTARLWDLQTRRERARIVHRGGVNAVAFSPDERYLASASDDGTARVMDTRTGQEVRRFQHEKAVYQVAFGPDNRTLATASSDHTARTFDVETGRERARQPHGQLVRSVAVSPDGRWVASGDGNGEVRLWRPDSGEVGATFSVGESLDEVVFSADGRYLAAAGDDTVVWDVARGVERTRVTVAQSNKFGQFLGVRFSPDGRVIATAGLDGHARCWQVSDGSPIADLPHEGAVMSIAFSRDGQHLATGSEDNLARVWEIATGRELLRQEHKEWPDAVAFSPDGRQLAVGSRDRSVRIEPWRAEDLIEQACARLGTNLTEDEWRAYLPDEAYRPTCP